MGFLFVGFKIVINPQMMVNFSLGEGCELCQWIRNMKRSNRKFHLLGGTTDIVHSFYPGEKKVTEVQVIS